MTRKSASRLGSSLAVLALACATMLPETGVASGARNLQSRIDRAEAGEVIELAPGSWQGPVRIDKSVILRGKGAVIDGGGEGTVVVLDAPGAQLEGLTIENGGGDVGGPDACVFVTKRSTGAVLRGNRLRGCTFGVWVHETDGVQILDNRVEGRDDLRVADRGNGIHLFDASHLIVRGNHVTDARDGIYVSATEDSLIAENRTSGQRFGIHYMYSYRNTLRNNVCNDNVIGMALMESLHLIVEDNEVLRNERNGILFRDVQFSRIRRNRLEGNGYGMFFFSSTENVVEDNRIEGNEIGLKVWAGTRRNRVAGNDIVGNRQQVFYVGAEDQVWGADGTGNHWGDYIGWDQDGDGVGDRPHRVESFKASLLYRYPAVALLLRSPALEILSHLSERIAMLQTPTIVDRAPRVQRSRS